MIGRLLPTVVADPAALADAAAAWTAERLTQAVADRGAGYIALAGGGTPRGCYQRLAQLPYQESLPWDRLFVYWSDERQVPLDDPESNFCMAKTALLDRVPIPPQQIFPLVGNPQADLERVPRDDAGRPRFDLIHLGLGEDGHTASLFPGDPALEEQRAWVAAVRASKPPPQRLTMTFPVLNAARAVLFLVSGAGKRQPLRGLLDRDPRLPASRVQPVDGELQLIADRSALPNS
ncbi:MAG: 6-phosphogluconolactonase [Candidatus Dormibacteraeota bacterium]|nr:6-phosphogluconolactonase [Candidatus Dormibacteraeota bacterium]